MSELHLVASPLPHRSSVSSAHDTGHFGPRRLRATLGTIFLLGGIALSSGTSFPAGAVSSPPSVRRPLPTVPTFRATLPEGRRVRVFVVGHKQLLDDALSIERFRAKMWALVDRAARSGEPRVQAGLDDVASHLAPHDPSAPAAAVVHFPEGTGLVAALIGSRGAAARSAATAFDAFAGLLGSYADPIVYYNERFPSLAGQPIRALQLALTDLLYRSVYETFREIALHYGIYVSVNLDAARARRIEATDDPALVRRLADPDVPDPSYAYVATSDLPRNVVWLFAPDGEVLAPDGRGGLVRSPSQSGGEIAPSAEKVYLTPIEQTLDKPGGGLSLASASARDLEVLPTEVGAIGVVISKDAWMVDVNERLEAKGADFLLQSEAFDQWAFVADPWAPDGFLQGGWFQLQARAGFLFNATPSLTGNLFDITFDAQSALLAKVRDKRRLPSRGSGAGFLGQPRRGGFLRVSPWIVPDPPRTTPPVAPGEDPLAGRRAALAAAGVRLLPSSGTSCRDPLEFGPCANGYREAVLWADVELPASAGASIAPRDRTRRATRFTASTPLAPSPSGQQRRPRAAAAGDVVAVVWDDSRDSSFPRVLLAISRDGGRRFGTPVPVSDAAPGEHAELYPDVAVWGDRIWVVWQSFLDGWNDDRMAIDLARFRTTGEKLGADVRVVGGPADPATGRWQPQIDLLPSGEPFVVWIDERDSGPDGVALAHVYGARGESGGDRFPPAVRIDDGVPVALAASLDNRWAPTLLVAGETIHVAWTDFRTYDWDIFATRSTDGGRNFAPSQELSTSCFFCDSPRFVRTDSARLWLAWTDLRAGPPDSNLLFVESRDDGVRFGAPAPLDDSRRGAASALRLSNQSHISFATSGGRVYAVWQDDRAGNNDVLFAPVEGYPRGVGTPERVDDSGGGPSNQYRPQLVVTRGPSASPRCVVVWEDDRDGRIRIYTASRICTGAGPPQIRHTADQPASLPRFSGVEPAINANRERSSRPGLRPRGCESSHRPCSPRAGTARRADLVPARSR